MSFLSVKVHLPSYFACLSSLVITVSAASLSSITQSCPFVVYHCPAEPSVVAAVCLAESSLFRGCVLPGAARRCRFPSGGAGQTSLMMLLLAARRVAR